MILEVTGTSTRNKGAELMLVAIVRRFAGRPEIELAVDANFGTYRDRARHGLLQKVRIERFGRSKLGFSLLAEGFRRSNGMTSEDQIDAIVDASGFAFGDQLPVTRAQRFAADCARWRAEGKPIVLLPQAFGPFECKTALAAFRGIAMNVDLLYARDSDSLRFARQAAPECDEKLRIAPDITMGLDGSTFDEPVLPANAAVIVPNARMLDRTAEGEAQAYIPFLRRCVDCCRDAALRPVLLIHDGGEDEAVVELLKAAVEDDLPVVRESDPLRLKGILHEAALVIGSRFHALVGALSGGVPSIAAGWSHKYERLFEEFACADQLLSVNAGANTVRKAIDAISGDHRRACSEVLLRRGDRARRKVDLMWGEIESALDVSR